MGKDMKWDESNIDDFPDYDEPGGVTGPDDDEQEEPYDPDGEGTPEDDDESQA